MHGDVTKLGRCQRCNRPVWSHQEFEAVPNDGTPEDGPGDAWLWHAGCAEQSAREAAEMEKGYTVWLRAQFASPEAYEAEMLAYEAWLMEDANS